MLLYIPTHAEYLSFLDSHSSELSFSDHKRLKQNKSFKSALWCLRKLNLDSVRDLLLSLYSPVKGRPANNPLLYIRSFILMLRLGYYSVDLWCHTVHSDALLQYMIGSSKPLSVSCHYDFINRIMHDKPSLSTLYPAGRNKSENKADLKKDQKWENYTDEDTLSLAMKYRDGAQFDRSRATFAIEKLFDLVAVRPSIRMKLIDQENLTAAGDGSCVHIHANRFGNKVKGAEDPDLDHRYSAPDANIGWDSDLGSWYYGYTLFNISVHNPVHKIDLPVFLAMGYASDHDALTSITATARMLDINPNLKPKHMCFDSAMDAYSIYEYLRLKDIIPVIDWNKRTSNPVNPYAKYENVDSDGVPLCTAGLRMIRDGYDNSKKATKYRCPVKAGKIHKCPLGNECSSSPYGRVKKTYDKTNYKLFGPIPYQSPKWKEIYKNRTCTERINNRILNDYGLHKMAVRNRSKNFFFSIMGAINIHLDAWHKVEG